MQILFFSFCGMVVGAKIFGFLTGIYRDIGLGKLITVDSLLDTGIVFYGGLLGGIGVYAFCLKVRPIGVDKQALDILAVCIPLFHSITRIGCFLSGCCYGKVYTGPLSIKYIVSIDGCIDINSRFPVQLMEALFEFVLFIYLLRYLQKDNWKSQRLLIRYLFLYSVGRFCIEFLRGDVRRGLIYGISFSQCVSIIIWVILIGYFKVYKKDKAGG